MFKKAAKVTFGMVIENTGFRPGQLLNPRGLELNLQRKFHSVFYTFNSYKIDTPKSFGLNGSGFQVENMSESGALMRGASAHSLIGLDKVLTGIFSPMTLQFPPGSDFSTEILLLHKTLGKGGAKVLTKKENPIFSL